MEIKLPIIIVIISMLMLASCDHYDRDEAAAQAQLDQDIKHIKKNTSKNSMRVADNVRDSIKRTNDRVREWWITPPPVVEKLAVPNRYCYRVLQDILCYRQPMPGWETRLVGYQGDNALPPPPAVTMVTPLRAENPESHPAKQAEKAKPVFAEMPPETKETKRSIDVPVAPSIDASQDTLPQSVLSPQI